NDLLLAETRDPVDNTITVLANDYRVLQPRLIRDPNGNRTELEFDTLGLVAGTAVMGKPTPVEGDTLGGLVRDPSQAQLDEFFARPRQPGPTPAESVATAIVHTLRGGATSRVVYDLDRLRRTQ